MSYQFNPGDPSHDAEHPQSETDPVPGCLVIIAFLLLAWCLLLFIGYQATQLF